MITTESDGRRRAAQMKRAGMSVCRRLARRGDSYNFEDMQGACAREYTCLRRCVLMHVQAPTDVSTCMRLHLCLRVRVEAQHVQSATHITRCDVGSIPTSCE